MGTWCRNAFVSHAGRCVLLIGNTMSHPSFTEYFKKEFNTILNIVEFSWIGSWERVLWRLRITRSAASVSINITMSIFINMTMSIFINIRVTMSCPSFRSQFFQEHFDSMWIWSGHRCWNTSLSHVKRCVLLMSNTMRNAYFTLEMLQLYFDFQNQDHWDRELGKHVVTCECGLLSSVLCV